MSDQFFDYESAGSAPGREAFLGNCTSVEWAMIAAHAETVRIRAGETAIAMGSLDRSLFIVVRGTLESVADTTQKHAAHKHGHGHGRTVHPVGSIVGELEFIDAKPASMTVRALTDAEVQRLPLARFEVLAAKDPALALYIMADLGRILATRLRIAAGGEETSP